MMIKKIAFAASCAAMLATMTAPAHADAYFIGGEWYYFSLNFSGTAKQITGKNLKDGTRVSVKIKTIDANVQCGNPQGKLISGLGPASVVEGSSNNLNPNDEIPISKTNREKGTFRSLTTVNKLVENGLSPGFQCLNNGGNDNYVPVYWRFDDCIKEGFTSTSGETCYQERAVATSFDGDTATTLMYATGPKWKTEITSPEIHKWTYVYLPLSFVSRAQIEVKNADGTWTASTDPNGIRYESCKFAFNEEPGAAYFGERYSLNNPPVNGWAVKSVPYICVPATQSEIDSLNGAIVN